MPANLVLFGSTFRTILACYAIIIMSLWQGLDEPRAPGRATFLVSLPGTPAIIPSVASPDPSVPAFTAREAIAYALAHPPEHSITNITASSVEFLTIRAMQARKMAIPGGDPERLVCIVTLNGLFDTFVPGLPGFEIATEHVSVYFDAGTGNFLGDTMQ